MKLMVLAVILLAAPLFIAMFIAGTGDDFPRWMAITGVACSVTGFFIIIGQYVWAEITA